MSEPHGSGLAVGDEVEVDVTAIAHGGHCIARHEGQVLFVRHAIPGERRCGVLRLDGSPTDAGRKVTRADDRIRQPVGFISILQRWPDAFHDSGTGNPEEL